MTIYGPYTNKNGRRHLVIYDNKVRKTISYPKYLVEQRLGITLKDNETIHHINGNYTDDRPENLLVIDRSKHVSSHQTKTPDTEIICIMCGEKAYKRANHLRHNRKQGKVGPFCGRQCAGRYGAGLQRHR